MSNQEQETPSVSERPGLFWLLLALVVVIWGGFWCAISLAIDKSSARGEFGDLFGAVNSLFSGLAFACLVYAIILQRKELALQREELMLSRKELAAQNQLIAHEVQLLQQSLTQQAQNLVDARAPIFVPAASSHYNGDEWRCTFEVTNADAFRVDVKFRNAVFAIPFESRTYRRGERFQLAVKRHAEPIFFQIFAYSSMNERSIVEYEWSSRDENPKPVLYPVDPFAPKQK